MTSAARLATLAAVIVVVGLLVMFSAKRDESPADKSAGGEVTPPPTGTSPLPPESPASTLAPPDGHVAGGVNGGDRAAAPDTSRQREIERVARLFDAGDRDVLGAVESALKQYPDDRELTGWLTRLEIQAQDSTGRRRQSAVGADATAAPSFSEADQTQREALDLGRQGMTAAAIRRLWEAEELFATALEWKADTSSTTAAPSRVKPAPETEGAVRIPLLSLARAYTALSAAAVKAAYPTLTADEAQALDRSFLDYSAYRLDIQIVRMMFRGDRVTVDCAIETVALLRSGAERRSTTKSTFVMEHSDGSWIITAASRLPH